jgi:AbrB family looped-hinge helix DNA binding protein
MRTRVRERYVGRLTSKGQTTVPKEVRDFLGLAEGTQVEWTIDDKGTATVRPRKLRAVDLAGFLGKPPNGKHATIEEMNDAVGQAISERFERAVKR